ncbi:MAG TPA: hypothetical protein VEJ87_04435, partial [Acidimicrobiales bacterium]|nr:hypothetical protein [Acidimicrobiales bacterium]
MHKRRSGHRRRIRVATSAIGALACSAVLLGACASPSSSRSYSETDRTCADVSAVLSDGPDPAADPVGYAEAQIGPLRELHTTDKVLQTRIDNLDSAYEQLFESNGAKAQLVTKASARLDALCPGAAP